MDIKNNSGLNKVLVKRLNRKNIEQYFENNENGTKKECSEVLDISYRTVINHLKEMEVDKCLRRTRLLFPKFFKTDNNEIVLQKKNNIYFRLEDVKSKLDFDCKMIQWTSRPSTKGVSARDQKYFAKRLNLYFDKQWTHEELTNIYTYLGCNCNRKLCIKFIKSGFDMSLLGKTIKKDKEDK